MVHLFYNRHLTLFLLSMNASNLSRRYCYQDTFSSHYSFDLLILDNFDIGQQQTVMREVDHS